MKGKLKTGIKILLMISVFCLAGLGFAVALRPKQYAQTSAAYTVNGQTVSGHFDGDVLLSAEKVYMNNDVIGAQFNDGETLFSSNGTYYYKNIQNGINEKTVVEHNQFVMLEDDTMSATNEDSETVALKQAVMLSFGQYFAYDNNEDSNFDGIKKITDTNANTFSKFFSKIRHLEVNVKFNGKSITDNKIFENLAPSVREITGGEQPYFDFMYVIPYNENNTGFYEFTFDYLDKNGSTRQAYFSFYLIYENSYIGNVEEDGNIYNAFPTIGWQDSNELFQPQPPQGEEYVRYYIGKDGLTSDGVSFPTITYDYTKYNLSLYNSTTKTTYVYEYPRDVENAGYITCTQTTKDGETTTKNITLYKYNSADAKHIVNIVLTEQGSYTFEFDYVYSGYNYQAAPEMPFEVESDTLAKKLAIHGFELDYKKYGYEKAQLRYFVLANHKDSHIDLIVPDGHQENEDLTEFAKKDVGFFYEKDKTSTEYAGTVLTSSQDALINNKIKSYLNASETNYLPKNILVKDGDGVSNALSAIKETDYVKTNYSAPWFSDLVDTYVGDNDGIVSTTKDGSPYQESFYFYSTKPIATNNLFDGEDKTTAKEYNNQTLFNAQGYYLVFIRVKPAGTSDKEYYQVYAFQYTTNTQQITVKDSSGREIDAYQYTNKNVTVTWEKPGKFERAITGYYYSKNDYDYYEKGKNFDEFDIDKDIMSSTATPFATNIDPQTQGYSLDKVADGHYTRYIIELRSEGAKSTCKTFTIDKQNIQDIGAYVVSEVYVGTNKVYRYTQNAEGDPIRIENGITDSYVAVNWNEAWNGRKPSGAYIGGTYKSTKIIPDGNVTAGLVTGFDAIQTSYTNTDVSGEYSVDRVSTDSLDIDKLNVRTASGLHVYTLTDDAGNSSKFMFVVDKTNAYLEIKSKDQTQYLSNVSVIYGDDVSYNAHNYKAIPLNMDDGADWSEIVKAACGSNIIENYYNEEGNSASILSKLFKKVGSTYYLTVKNRVAYRYADDKCENATATSGVSGQINYQVSEKSSYIRTLYVFGENNVYSSNTVVPRPTNSRVQIEINTDNSRVTVYHDPYDLNLSRIDPVKDGQDTSNGIQKLELGNHAIGAPATRAEHVAMVFNLGSGDYEVETIDYAYYELSDVFEEYDKNIAPTVERYQELDMYKNTFRKDGSKAVNYTNIYTRGSNIESDGTRGFFDFAVNGSIEAGLYIIRRTYTGNVPTDSKDSKVRYFYFVVDYDGISSGEMALHLLNGETKVAVSDPINPTDLDFKIKNSAGEDQTIVYNINLTTDKVPLTMDIPMYKRPYSGMYESGQLMITLYYYDNLDLENKTFDQLYGRPEAGSAIVLYKSSTTDKGDGFHTINIATYLKGNNKDYILKHMTQLEDGDGYMYLPGHYVLVVEDRVFNGEKNSTPNKFTIGVEIKKGEQPQTNISTGFQKEAMASADVQELKVETNNEFVEIKLPEYVENLTKAQIDPTDYTVWRILNGSKTDVSKENKYVKVENGNIWLDTGLRKDGKIDPESFKNKLEYEVTIRYKTKHNGDFSEMYHYYKDNTKVDYYYTTYKITIDRLAPENNIKNLQTNESEFINNLYASEYQNNSQFEDWYHETGSKIYFTKQYKEYYKQSKQAKLLYVFNVDNSTEFDKSDIDKLYVKSWEDSSDIKLTLPVNEFSAAYTPIDLYNTDFMVDGKIMFSKIRDEAGIYEFVEFDRAGNMNQYLVNYLENNAMLNIGITYVPTTAQESNSSNINATIGQIDSAINAFEIEQRNATNTNNGDYFYIVKLTDANGQVIYSKATNLTTKFDDGDNSIGDDIIDLINQKQKGTFTLEIISKNNVAEPYSIQIGLFDKNNFEQLSIDEIIVKEGGVTYVDFREAVKRIDNTVYYATQISIEEILSESNSTINTYVCAPNKDYKFYHSTGGQQATRIACTNTNATYRVKMTDIFGETKSTIFKLSGEELFRVYFENEFNAQTAYHKDGDIYYGYTNGSLQFDNAFEIGHVELILGDPNATKNSSLPTTGKVPVYLNETSKTIIFDPNVDDCKYIYLKVDFGKGKNGEFEKDITYEIVVDARFNQPRFTNEADNNNLRMYDNQIIADSFADVKENPLTPMTGTKSININRVKNDYFVYKYILHEKMLDGTISKTEITTDSIIIDTNDDLSAGIYMLEMEVWGTKPASNKLGNKIFAFEVHSLPDQLYYIKDIDSKVYNTPQAEYNFSDYNWSEAQWTGTGPSELPTANIPLYIANKELSVVFREEITNINEYVMSKTTQMNGADYTYTFKLYKFEAAPGLYLHFGILEVPSMEELVYNATIYDLPLNANNAENQGKAQMLFIENKDDTKVYFKANRVSTQDDPFGLLAKNKLVLNIANDTVNPEKIAIDSQEYISDIEYEVLGNWQYKFTVSDLAGNFHKFLDGETYARINIAREVVVKVNDNAAIDNAFYNEAVRLEIVNADRYKPGELVVRATRNGSEYTPELTSRQDSIMESSITIYNFTEYGTYKVVVVGTYEDENYEHADGTKGIKFDLVRVLVFNIVNVEESKKSVDLSSLRGYNIDEITNSEGKDVTKIFKDEIFKNGMKVSYDSLLEHAEKLNVSQGKQTFKVKYSIKDGIYPYREAEFMFTLNNEIPTINYEVNGNSTEFTIEYNPGIIYSKVGEATIYINDEPAVTIDASSPTEVMYLTRTHNDGVGDYYVKLETKSGTVLTSFKVSLREPLNVWAIIIIVVVVITVITVTIVIIVLRNKMRIR